jgi:hypothetical protein
MKTLIAVICIFASSSALADTVAGFTLPSGVNVKITEAKFKKTLFKISGCTEGSKICRINGRTPFGNDIDLPKTYVKSISVSYQSQSYSLDASDMYNAWGERPLEYKGTVRYFGGKCSDTKNCRFRGLFSDGAGSFVAEWQIVNGVPIRTVLSDSNDIVNLFMQHIDPPEFDQ